MLANKMFLLLNIYHVLVDGLFDSVPIILSFMIVSFGAGAQQAGFITSLAVMASTLAGLSTVYISRRLGFLHSLSAIILFYGIGYLGNAFAWNSYLAGVFFIIAISGYGVFHNIAFSFITAQAQRQSLGKAMGDFTAIGDVGRIPFASFAGFLAAIPLFGFPGWKVVCLFYGTVALAVSAFIWWQSRIEATQDKNTAAPDKRKMKRFPSFALLRNRQIALPVAANVLDAFCSDQIFTFLPFLLFSKGIDPKIIGSFALAFTLGCFLGKKACGRMVDAFGTRIVFVISEISMAALLLALILGRQLYAIIGASLLLGVVTKGTIPVIQTIITEPVANKSDYDDVFSISTFARGATNIVTPVLFGFISSSIGIQWAYAAMSAVALLAVMPVLLMKARTHPQ